MENRQLNANYFSLYYFSGDTIEHNKLSSLQWGSMGKFPHWMCCTTRSNLSSPQNVSLEKMTKGSKIWDTNCTALKALGYYACQANVLYDLQYCDIVGGFYHALPPDILHAVLLGYVTRLVHGFTQLKKMKMIPCIFFLMHIKKKSKVIYLPLDGHCQNKVVVIYLAHIFQVDTCIIIIIKKMTMEVGKNAHELWGVLLPVLTFLLLNGQNFIFWNKDWLSGFIKVMELTILLEAWLNKDEFCEEDLCLFDKFVPYFIHTFTMVVNRTEGQGMKLIKVHLLHHFTTMVQLFCCAKILIHSFQRKIASQKSKNI